MTAKTLARVIAGATAIAGVAASGAAFAQAQPARPAAAPAAAAQPLGGPNIPGVCILDNGRLVQQSQVGRHVISRIQALSQQVNTELQTQQNALRTEGQTLQNQKVAGTDPRVAAYQQKAQTFGNLAQQREREMRETERLALQRIGTEADSVVRSVYTQKGCGILIDRNSVFGANSAMDVTDQVIAGLNAKITTFTIERARLQQPAAPAAAPARQ